MRTQFAAIAALAGSAYAGLEAYQPPAPAYGSETTPAAPVYESSTTPVAPVYKPSTTPVAPVYESSTTPVAPVYESSTTPVAPVYSSTTCSEETESPTAPAYVPAVTPSTPSSPSVPTGYGSASAPPTYTSSTPACPAAGEMNGNGQYSCNPAHSYPEGQTCEVQNGCYYLVYPHPSASTPSGYGSVTVTPPGYTAPPSTPSSPVTPGGYGSASMPPTYPSSTPSCPAAGSMNEHGQYSCNPAHAYPEGQTCEVQNGCYYLVYPTSSGSPPPAYSSPSGTAPAYVPSVTPSSPIQPSAPGYGVPSYSMSTATVPAGPSGPYGYGNQTHPAGTGSAYPTSTGPATYTGAASKMAGGAILGAVGIIAALFL